MKLRMRGKGGVHPILDRGEGEAAAGGGTVGGGLRRRGMLATRWSFEGAKQRVVYFVGGLKRRTRRGGKTRLAALLMTIDAAGCCSTF
jgi:hypothetical protein